MTKYVEQFWRDATDKDVVRVMNGETVEARFSDETTAFFYSAITGWMNSRRDFCQWVNKDGASWRYCQVYSPPQWWLDKPDPGEGYRLLDKFPDEPVQGGDCAWDRGCGWLKLLGGCVPTQAEGIWYRRRIEQPKPEPKHYVLQVGDSVETPCGNLIKIIKLGIIQRHLLLKVGDTISTPSGRQAIVTEHGIEVT